MKKTLFLVFIFTVFYSNNIFASEDRIYISCKNSFLKGRGEIVRVGKQNTDDGFVVMEPGNITFTSLTGFPYASRMLPYELALSKGAMCTKADAVDSAYPLLQYTPSIFDIGNFYVFTNWMGAAGEGKDVPKLNQEQFENIFGCFCKLNPDLLHGCTARYSYEVYVDSGPDWGDSDEYSFHAECLESTLFNVHTSKSRQRDGRPASNRNR